MFFETARRAVREPSGLAGAVGPLGLPEGTGTGLVLRYQPVVSLRDRRPVMVEALARWNAPQGEIGADVLVPAAENAGLGLDLTAAVARRVADELAHLLPSLDLTVSINMPLNVLDRPDVVGWLETRLALPRALRARVALELTETTPVEDRSRLALALRRLRAAGHEVLLDDLQPGDGRAGLLRLPFSGVKLDRSAVEALPGSAAARLWLRRLVRAASARGQSVTAEGVGTRAHWAALRSAGVGRAQGYLVARPMPAEALRAWAALWRGSAQPAKTRA